MLAFRIAVLAAGVAVLAAWPAAAGALTLPPGFERTTAIAGLNDPMDAEIAPNGRVFVAEKGGTIQTFDDLSDPAPTTFADLRTEVHNFSSRGLLGLAVDPAFPADPYVYVYYTLNAPIGGTPPTFGNPGQTVDQCPGDTDDVNCIVSQRVSRLRVAGEQQDGPEQVLVNDWCQQFQFHPGGGIEFGADGYLYVSGGDGARWEIFDYGQLGNPMNPCGDPPSPVGGPMSPPTAEGGRLRAQDLRTSGDPLGLNGSLIRIDPDTGEGVPGNPMFASPEPNARRMLAHGFRNPVRLAIRPGTNDVWVADRGGGYWEEFDRVPDPTDPVRNFGWPCYEGGLDAAGVPYARIRPRSDDQELDICENLYALGSATSAPYWGYDHELPVVPGEDCATNPGNGEPIGNQIGGVNFYPATGSFPVAYRNALFFADRLRNCMWVMLPGPDGVPKRGRVIPFGQQLERAMDIEVAPGGDLLYVDQGAEVLQRIEWVGNSSNHAPTADAQADTVTGNRPLTVTFDSSGSSDSDAGDLLIYEWDLDGDGELDDSTEEAPTHTYLQDGTYTVTLRVTDTSGAFDEDTLTINAGGGGPPTPSINTPAAGTTWAVGQSIAFTGSATDPDDGTLPGTALDWQLIIHHCTAPGDCHQHGIQSFENTAGGTFSAPDHEYPSHLELKLTATDSQSNTATVSRLLDPRTINVTAASDPPGLSVSVASASGIEPQTVTVIEGSANTISASSPQVKNNTTYEFASWSDGQTQTHNVAPRSSTTYTARFAPHTPGISTLTFSPSADARVEQLTPASNFGTATTLRTDAGADPDAESYLRFIVDGLAGRIQSAKLRIASTAAAGGNTADGPAAYPTSSSWSETSVNWNNKPAPTGAALADSGAIPLDSWTEWDVTPAVVAEGEVSFRLAQTGNDGVNFNSRESATVDRRPELVLTVLNDAYARPKGATPTRVALVPAFNACTTANRTHGPPLEHPSCSPPVRSSSELTVGTPDANGRPAGSSGFVSLTAKAGSSADPADDADVALAFQLSDVRNGSAPALDYTGELQFRTTLRLTDRESAATGGTTLEDIVLPVTVPCAATPDVLTGGACGLTTTVDAVTPGFVDEGARSVWQLGAIEVLDGGPDGDAETPGNAVFARPGIFVP